MLSPLAQRVLQHIRKHTFVRPGDRVAIAVSGGADSVALLRLLLELRSELGVVLSVAHFHHMIREEAGDDMGFVRDLAARHELEFHYSIADTPQYAREKHISLEAAGRELRYNFFSELAGILEKDNHADKVATAHTLDDQAETVLMRVVRGTGISGLAGILPRRIVRSQGAEAQLEIIRPLLPFRRPELERYLRSVDQPWREDATNAELHHTRNRIRHLVLPLLEREINPAVREHFAELTDIAYEEEQFWAKYMRDLISESELFKFDLGHVKPWLDPSPSTAIDNPQALRRSALFGAVLPFIVSIHLPKLLQMPIAVQRRALRYATRNVCSLSFEEVNRALQLARGELQGEIELADGLRVWCERDALKLGNWQVSESTHYEYHVPVHFEGTSQFTIGSIQVRINVDRGSTNRDAFDITKLSAPELTLRPWRPGDRFWPQHSSAPKKVKELLTDKHITGVERQLWPVIASGDDIVWLRGFGVSQPFAADEGDTNAIVITEQKLDEAT